MSDRALYYFYSNNKINYTNNLILLNIFFRKKLNLYEISKGALPNYNNRVWNSEIFPVSWCKMQVTVISVRRQYDLP